MKEERFSPVRVIMVLACIILSALECLYLCMRQSLELKDMAVYIAVGVMLTIAVFLAVVTGRRSEDGFYNGTNYRNLLIVLAAAWLMIDLSPLIPEFFFPAALLMGVLTCELSGILSLSVGMGMVLLLCITESTPQAVTFTYILECVFAALFLDYIKKTEYRHRIAPAIMILLSEFAVKISFYYLTFRKIEVRELIIAGGCALSASLFAVLLLPLISDKLSRERLAFYETLLDEEYPLLVELKEYSLMEYSHALRVCELARDCALEIGVDANLAAAGGLYYRIGKMYGEPELNNSIAAAHRYNFPRELVSILYEFEGINRKPSSVESAIVLMSDRVVKKIDTIRANSDTMESNWNQNMVIYQTLNELSNEGMLDESGMGMNSFLKIREKLVSEDKVI